MELSDSGLELWYFQYFGLIILLFIVIYKFKNILFNRNSHKKKICLSNKVVVIIGACSGIGEALSHIFYERGCKVILASKRRFHLEKIKRDLISKRKAYSKEPLIFELDKSNLDYFIHTVHVVCGHIDIFINNFGVSPRASASLTRLDVYREVMEINFYQAVSLTLAAVPKMVKRNSGHVVYINSVQGLKDLAEYSAYAASKHALQAFGYTLRAEMKPHKVNVSMINLGFIKTDAQINALSGDDYQIVDARISVGLTPWRVASKIVNIIVNAENGVIIS